MTEREREDGASAETLRAEAAEWNKGFDGKKKPEILPWFLTLGQNRKKVYEAQVFISKSKLKIRRIYSNMRTKTGP